MCERTFARDDSNGSYICSMLLLFLLRAHRQHIISKRDKTFTIPPEASKFFIICLTKNNTRTHQSDGFGNVKGVKMEIQCKIQEMEASFA